MAGAAGRADLADDRENHVLGGDPDGQVYEAWAVKEGPRDLYTLWGAPELARRWLDAKNPESVLDAAALILYGGRDLRECLEILRKGRTRDGGWGPYVTSPPEVFDTAIAVLALARHRERPEVGDLVRRGREYLIRTQETDGSWPETTRPPGAESYAQRISTTGWALLALLSTPP